MVRELEYRLTPLWDGRKIPGMQVNIREDAPEIKKGGKLFTILENLIRYMKVTHCLLYP